MLLCACLFFVEMLIWFDVFVLCVRLFHKFMLMSILFVSVCVFWCVCVCVCACVCVCVCVCFRVLCFPLPPNKTHNSINSTRKQYKHMLFYVFVVVKRFAISLSVTDSVSVSHSGSRPTSTSDTTLNEDVELAVDSTPVIDAGSERSRSTRRGNTTNLPTSTDDDFIFYESDADSDRTRSSYRHPQDYQVNYDTFPDASVDDFDDEANYSERSRTPRRDGAFTDARSDNTYATAAMTAGEFGCCINTGYEPVSKCINNLVRDTGAQFNSNKLRARASHVLQKSAMGLVFQGTCYCYWFLEICAGSAVLTQAVRLAGLTTLRAVDKLYGDDLLSPHNLHALMDKIKQWRPLHTHMAPCCRIFSQAYNPRNLANSSEAQEVHRSCMNLALTLAKIAKFIVELGLFVCIEQPLRTTLYKLEPYRLLHMLAGFFFVDLNLCMYGLLHSVTGKSVWKGLRLLTNAPWMLSFGLMCNRQHEHTPLVGGYQTAKSAEYPWNFCVAYASCLSKARAWLKALRNVFIPVSNSDPNFRRVGSLVVTGRWPNIPLVYTTGQLEAARREQVNRTMAPLVHSDESLAEREKEFGLELQWLTSLKVPATRLEYQTFADGRAHFKVTFRDQVFDIRDFHDKYSMTFTEKGRHGARHLGYDRAAAQAFAAYNASKLGEQCSIKFGCGALKWNGHHGNSRNEFCVYSFRSYLELSEQDPTWQTFVPNEQFCWNCTQVTEADGAEKAYLTKWKCLGHDTGSAEHLKPKQLQYADSSIGWVRNTYDTNLQSAQKASEQLDPPAEVYFSMGFVQGELHSIPKHLETLLSLLINLKWRSSHEPYCGILAFRSLDKIDTPESSLAHDQSLLAWHADNGRVATIQVDGVATTLGKATTVVLGTYYFDRPSSGCIFVNSPLSTYADHKEELEIMSFPVHSSLRITGLDKSLSSLWIERGRLLQMYRTCPDTQHIMLLLLHGACKLRDSRLLPEYADEEKKDELKTDLMTIVKNISHRRAMSADEVTKFGKQFYLPLLGGVMQNDAPSQFSTPIPSSGCDWSDVSFRLTLGWNSSDHLCLEHFEIAGASMIGPPHLAFSPTLPDAETPRYVLTLFFGYPDSVVGSTSDSGGDDSVLASRSGIDFVNVEGANILEQTEKGYVGSGYGSVFSSHDLNELSRRSGIPRAQLDEALELLKRYRLTGGRVQYRMYDRTAGGMDWFTVIPSGAWRSVEQNGQKRQCSLRRFVILMFHNTPMCPHQNRDRTVSSILNAGLWWKGMFKEVESVLRHCLICVQSKGQPLVTSHQRSREYDGPFRYLVSDFVGPISPTTDRGNKYMFTCACAWSGWYWTVPTADDNSQTAARCLFMYVICDLAGYPVCLGSDRAPAFIQSVVEALSQFFGIHQVIGSGYHPQAQSPVERPHREYNMLCKTFCDKFGDWDQITQIFKWTVITTAKIFNGSYTPYEIVTGLKPRSPIDGIFSDGIWLTRVSHEQYVTDLVRYLKEVHQYVDSQHERVRQRAQEAKYRELGPSKTLRIGDYCFVKRHVIPKISQRLQNPNFDDVYQVVEVHGDGSEAKTYTVADLSGKRTGLGFGQPVACERLTPVELLPLTPPSEDVRTKLVIFEGNQERRADIKAQSLDGCVYLEYEDDPGHSVCVDLSQMNYRWA